MHWFKNKIVIVTGGASGIGAATVKKFFSKGARVIIVDIDHKGEILAQSLSRDKKLVQFVHCDVSSANGVKTLVQHIEKEMGGVDILINNAGIEISGKIANFSESAFDQLVAVNLKSVFLCSKAVLPGMMKRRQGTIVNLASVAAILAWPDDAIYSATKAAVFLLTKGLALECAPYNVRVNAVAPSITDTPMTDRALAHYTDKERVKREKAELNPLGRLGKPEEVAEAILFLSSKSASFITGTILPVDGGYLAG